MIVDRHCAQNFALSCTTTFEPSCTIDFNASVTVSRTCTTTKVIRDNTVASIGSGDFQVSEGAGFANASTLSPSNQAK
jgi:hypothetical protein